MITNHLDCPQIILMQFELLLFIQLIHMLVYLLFFFQVREIKHLLFFCQLFYYYQYLILPTLSNIKHRENPPLSSSIGISSTYLFNSPQSLFVRIIFHLLSSFYIFINTSFPFIPNLYLIAIQLTFVSSLTFGTYPDLLS